MRILLAWDYYPSQLKSFYRRYPEAHLLPFAEQNRLLCGEGFQWAAYLVPELRKLGHEAESYVANAEPVQSMWARENGIEGSASRMEVLREQIRSYRPDILWIGTTPQFLGEFLRSVRSYCGVVVAWRAAAGWEQFDWTGVDCILSSHSNFVQKFRALGLRSELVLPCVDSALVSECLASAGERDHDITFYGTLSVTLFANRLRFLSGVTKHVPCNIHSDRWKWQRRPRPLRPFLTQLRYLPFRRRTRFAPAAYGRELMQLIAESRIVLNAHVDSADGLAGNIRMFEATAMGALLVTDACRNLSEIFEPEREVVTYSNTAEAVEKLRYYLQHPEERETIARAGQERTLRCYNSSIRAREVLQIFSSLASRS